MSTILEFLHGRKFSFQPRQEDTYLSSGLVMPKIVVEDLGVVRTDVGCLGYGIYFSDSASTALRYTIPSTIRPDRRLLCVCQVALGDIAHYDSFSPTLTQPPIGFHSTHGVKRTQDQRSMFNVSSRFYEPSRKIS